MNVANDFLFNATFLYKLVLRDKLYEKKLFLEKKIIQIVYASRLN